MRKIKLEIEGTEDGVFELLRAIGSQLILDEQIVLNHITGKYMENPSDIEVLVNTAYYLSEINTKETRETTIRPAAACFPYVSYDGEVKSDVIIPRSNIPSVSLGISDIDNLMKELKVKWAASNKSWEEVNKAQQQAKDNR